MQAADSLPQDAPSGQVLTTMRIAKTIAEMERILSAQKEYDETGKVDQTLALGKFVGTHSLQAAPQYNRLTGRIVSMPTADGEARFVVRLMYSHEEGGTTIRVKKQNLCDLTAVEHIFQEFYDCQGDEHMFNDCLPCEKSF